VLITLFAQVAKYHKDFDFSLEMPFVYKVIYLYIKGSLSEIGNKLAETIHGTMAKQIVRFIVHTLKPKALD
jgi:hypothetical protein